MAFLLPGEYFEIFREVFKVILTCGTTLLLGLDKLLMNDQSDYSILSHDHKFI